MLNEILKTETDIQTTGMKNGWFSLLDSSITEDRAHVHPAQSFWAWHSAGLWGWGWAGMTSICSLTSLSEQPPSFSLEVLAACLFQRVPQPAWLGTFPWLILGPTFPLAVVLGESHTFPGGIFSLFQVHAHISFSPGPSILGPKTSPCLYSHTILRFVQTFELGPWDMTDLMEVTDWEGRQLLVKQLHYERTFVHGGKSSWGQGCGLQEYVVHKLDLAWGEQISGLSGKRYWC